jgi:hypothetical protein
MYNGEDSANVDWMTDGVGLAWEVRNIWQKKEVPIANRK